MNPPDSLKTALEKPVAIFGGGASGRGVLALVQALGGKGVIFDEKSSISGLVNNFGPEDACKTGLVVFSPGFRPDHPWFATAAAAGCERLAELDFAWCCWKGNVVAVTGTNGKTTLTEFLAHA